MPDRQQTLRNTLQWSYDLLTRQEQRLFTWGIALVLSLLGRLALQWGELSQAEAFLADGARLASEVGDRRNVARSRLMLAGLVAQRGDYAVARLWYAESLSTALDIRHTSLIASGLKGLGCALARIKEGNSSFNFTALPSARTG